MTVTSSTFDQAQRFRSNKLRDFAVVTASFSHASARIGGGNSLFPLPGRLPFLPHTHTGHRLLSGNHLSTPTMTTRFLSLPDGQGCRMAYRVCTPASAEARARTPLFLINGLSAVMVDWTPLFEALGASRTWSSRTIAELANRQSAKNGIRTCRLKAWVWMSSTSPRIWDSPPSTCSASPWVAISSKPCFRPTRLKFKTVWSSSWRTWR